MLSGQSAGRRRAEIPRHGRRAATQQSNRRGRRRAAAPPGPVPQWTKPTAILLGAAGLLSVVVLPAQGSDGADPTIQAGPVVEEKVTADPAAEVTFGRSAVSTVAGRDAESEDPPLRAAGSVEAATGQPKEIAEEATDPAPAVDPGLNAPLGSMAVTSSFGYRTSPLTGAAELHTGLDLAASCSTEVLAAREGTVVEAGWSPYGGGNRIVIDHGNDLKTTYNHLASIGVSVGQVVQRDELIAGAGTTGNSTGCHLHFEVMINDSVVDPTQWL